MRRLARRSRAERPDGSASEWGQALVEMALVLPILLLCVLGAFDIGRVIYADFTVENAAREAARVALVEPDMTQAKYNAVRAAARQAATGLSASALQITGGNVPCNPADSLSPSKCFYPEGVDSGLVVLVNVSIKIELVTPFIGAFVGDAPTVSAQSRSFMP